MKQSTYDAVVSTIRKRLYQAHEKDWLSSLAKDFPGVSNGTLLSIYSQYYQSYTKAVHRDHNRADVARDYYTQYRTAMSSETAGGQKSNLLLDMARKVTFSPCLFSRIILEQFALAQEPPLIPSAGSNSVISQWMKSPGKIPDCQLREQVKACILNDSNYGPLAENMKHSVGYEYEFLLKEKIDALEVPYLDEKELRDRGYDKTPDFKLEIPIAVGKHVVNWIESKASFGDNQSHSRYLEEQFWSYQNRFGSGLVIYWFGFIEELDVHTKQGIMLLDHFPSEVTTLELNSVP